MADETLQQPEAQTQDERAMRRSRRQALIDAGVDPYPARSHVSDRAADLIERYVELEPGADTDDVVSVAGRIRAIRNQGKAAFLVLQDSTATIQLFCRSNVLGEDEWGLLGSLDIGDIVEATGTVMRTRRGELSISPTSLGLLTKSLRPLPEKFHGMTDKETRYRQRYVDLIMNPEVKETFTKRSKIVHAIRTYMMEQGYMEMETPILQEIQGGATAKPFITHFNALDQECYLRIATELHLKRLLVGGFERVFEIGRIFRNEGMDPTHNPEFTSMEAYCAYSDLEGMKRLSEGLFKAANAAVNDSDKIVYQGVEIDLGGTWRSARMVDLVSEVVGEKLDLDTPTEHLRELCEAKGIETQDSWGSGKLIFELYDELVEKTIVDPTFVCDYPVEVSPLSKRKPDDPRLTERFELVIAGSEYANAFSELNDPVDQESRFAAQMEAKASGDDEAMGYDTDYIRALEYGMPPAGGIGYGIDRLVMLLCDEPSIRDVLLFPHMRPEAGRSASPSEATRLPLSATAGVGGADFADVDVEPLDDNLIEFDQFLLSDYRVVKVKDCVAVPKSKKLLQFTLDDGSGTDRTILSGIHGSYEPEVLVGKTLVAITNLAPRKMMGIESCGMLISAVHHDHEEHEGLNLLMLDDRIPAGAKLC